MYNNILSSQKYKHGYHSHKTELVDNYIRIITFGQMISFLPFNFSPATEVRRNPNYPLGGSSRSESVDTNYFYLLRLLPNLDIDQLSFFNVKLS